MNDLSTHAGQLAHYASIRRRLWNAPPPAAQPSRVRTIDLLAPPPPKLPMIIVKPQEEPERDWLIVGDVPAPDEDDSASADKAIFRPGKIIKEVAAETGCSVADLKSGARHHPLVQARQYLMWRLIRETSLSQPQVGELIKRDHTTVLSGVRSHERRMRNGTALWGNGA